MAEKTKPVLITYTLTKDFEAPSMQPAETGKALRTKKFTSGASVSGYVPKTRPEDNIVPLIIVDGEWGIPLQFLQKPSDTVVDDIKSTADKLKNNTIVKQIGDATKNNIHAAMLGAGAGIVTAWAFGKSKVLFGIAGALIAAFIAKKINTPAGTVNPLPTGAQT